MDRLADVPAAFALFPKDLSHAAARLGRALLQRPALDRDAARRPLRRARGTRLLADDLRDFFRPLRPGAAMHSTKVTPWRPSAGKS